MSKFTFTNAEHEETIHVRDGATARTTSLKVGWRYNGTVEDGEGFPDPGTVRIATTDGTTYVVTRVERTFEKVDEYDGTTGRDATYAWLYGYRITRRGTVAAKSEELPWDFTRGAFGMVSVEIPDTDLHIAGHALRFTGLDIDKLLLRQAADAAR
jgi:hypothetical protein